MKKQTEDFIDKKISEIRLEIYAGLEKQLMKAKEEFRKLLKEEQELMEEEK